MTALRDTAAVAYDVVTTPYAQDPARLVAEGYRDHIRELSEELREEHERLQAERAAHQETKRLLLAAQARLQTIYDLAGTGMHDAIRRESPTT